MSRQSRAPRSGAPASPADVGPAARDPLLAVVIPVYKQSQYLAEAVISATRQSLAPWTRIVIVNDGCPYPETGRLGRQLQRAFAGQVYYLDRPNGGLSSARNYGIKFALACWPTVMAVFPLDADNRLGSSTLELLWARLWSSRPEVGFAYQDLSIFGAEDSVWRTGVPFSLFRLLAENYCDAGGLIRRSVFEAGVWFDEAMRDGYEDWEFYIRAGLSGFRGLHIGETGFQYRKQNHSMLTDAQSKHGSIRDYIAVSNPLIRSARYLTALEHRELPRFALIDVETATVGYTTDLWKAPDRVVSVASFIDQVNDWARQEPPKTVYVPPIVLLARGTFLDWLRSWRLLPGLGLLFQKLLRDHKCVTLTAAASAELNVIELAEGAATVAPALLAASTRTLVELNWESDEPIDRLRQRLQALPLASLLLGVGDAFQAAGPTRAGTARHAAWETVEAPANGEPACARDDGAPPALWDVTSALAGQLRTPVRYFRDPRRDGTRDWCVPSHTEFGLARHVEQEQTTFPFVFDCQPSRKELFFCVPWLGLGGVDRCVLSLADSLARCSRLRLHLVVTERNRLELAAERLDPFETITFLPRNHHERQTALVDVLASADLVLNTHSLACYDALSLLRKRTDVRILNYLHVVDINRDGCPDGYPLLAARTYNAQLDGFVVISEQLRRYCLNLGVPEQKLCVLPNAPTVAPANLEAGLALAKLKGGRSFSRSAPARILFAGRFDYQKGIDRLERIAALLDEIAVPYELQLIGKGVLDGDMRSVAFAGATILPATVHDHELESYYNAADIVLLPSRWEGVPLSVLEGMAFGNVVICTNVGAVGEVVLPGQTGLLLDAEASEERLAAEAVKMIQRVVESPADFIPLRQAACRAALGYSWDDAAARLLDWIEAAG